MASAETPTPTTDIPPSDVPSLPKQDSQATQSQQVSSTPIEMRPLASSHPPEQQHTSIFGPTPTQPEPTPQLDSPDAVTAAGSESQQVKSLASPEFLNFDPQVPASTDNASAEVQSSATRLTRTETAPAIGPATDKPTLLVENTTEGPVLFITLLLASTGARHPYKLDGKYLKKRSVDVEGDNPINMSLYKLKELILRDWRNGKSTSSDLTYSGAYE